jgi:Mn2+/Fe2+ NRAMP family transporter
LAIPILAGSAAYAIGEACRWPIGLSRHPDKAVAFYSTVTAAAILGVAITLSPIDPIKALYWTAVINGVVAVPVMAVMMLMTAQPRIMGKFVISGLAAMAGLGVFAAISKSWLRRGPAPPGPSGRTRRLYRGNTEHSYGRAWGAL